MGAALADFRCDRGAFLHRGLRDFRGVAIHLLPILMRRKTPAFWFGLLMALCPVGLLLAGPVGRWIGRRFGARIIQVSDSKVADPALFAVNRICEVVFLFGL